LDLTSQVKRTPDVLVEYKKSEDFAKESARGKKSRGKKEHDQHHGRGGYALAVLNWEKMEEDLLA
jgi:hypothetical protein